MRVKKKIERISRNIVSAMLSNEKLVKECMQASCNALAFNNCATGQKLRASLFLLYAGCLSFV